MTRRLCMCGAIVVFLVGLVARAEVKVTTEQVALSDASPWFKFKTVPGPWKDDAGTKAKFTIVDGERDERGGEITKLNDGTLPANQDQPAENFYFNQGLDGGRIQVDMGSVIDIKQVNSFSWHTSSRAPQVYKLYAADGAASGFNAAPEKGTDPATCGWKLIATVDTRPKTGEPGGQYGVSVSDTTGSLGKYRYLLFDTSRTEDTDDFGNTFYSEIDVVDQGAGAAADAGVKVTVDHNTVADGSFKFKNVPTPATDNAARKAKITVVDGEVDPPSGGLEKLNDGKLPTDEDQPDENFFFLADSEGGRLKMDLGSVINIKEINTYSWHPNTRGPQVYKLYISDGADPGFNAAPKTGTDPAKCGWKLIANVDTRPKTGDDGGQYGVNISDASGSLGKARYILIAASRTEDTDGYGNTFFSEITVIEAK